MTRLPSMRLDRGVLGRRRIGRHVGPAVPPEVLPGPRAILALAAWFGLLTGMAELAVMLVGRLVAGASMLGSVQMHRHFLWMIPVAHVAILTGCGLPLSVLAARAPRAARRATIFIGLAIGVFALLVIVRGLYASAAGLLAVGLAWRLTGWLEPRTGELRRAVRRSLPGLVGIVGLLGGWSYYREVLHERMTLASLSKPAPGKPNVLLIVLDTVRADHLSLYGYDRRTAPNLERLAKRGVVFQEARSAAPWTLPSHASLFTGRWPLELGVGDEQPLDRRYPTLAEYLAGHGYATAGFIANTYFCNSWYGLARGFAHYEDYYEENVMVSPAEALRCTGLGRWLLRQLGTAYNIRSDNAVTQKTAERINHDFLRWLDRNPGRRFFTFLNYMDAHDPYVPPASFGRHFGRVPETPEDHETLHTWSKFIRAHAAAPKGERPARDVELIRDAYDDCLAYLDEQLGRLFEELDRRGLMDETLVILTSDHGEELGEHGLYGHGVSLYRPELRVPLLMVGPSGVPAGRTLSEPVSLRDVPATVVERLGLTQGSPFPGRTLARAWDPAAFVSPTADDAILSTIEIVAKRRKKLVIPGRAPAYCGPMASVVIDGQVYIRDAYDREELYDLASDPGETENLAGSAGAGSHLERGRAEVTRLVPDSPVRR